MHLAIDALPINNFSGRAVLNGHLRNLARATAGRHRISVLHHAGNRDLVRDLGTHVRFVECAGTGPRWFARLAWQALHMQARLDEIGADVLLSTSGALVPRVRLPQWVLVQNPWCYFPQFHAGLADRLKARLQRHGYRQAQRRANALFYLSDFMARTYRQDSGTVERAGATVLVGVDDRYFEAARYDPPGGFADRALEIVAVSVMTPHKSIEDILDALAGVRSAGCPARLALVGPWADPGYRRTIEARIDAAGLRDAVEITGQVDDASLQAHYRRARVFCLLSRCESFGIPAVEAQAFATPCVVADVCAPPEIAGPGGTCVPAGNLQATIAALVSLLTDAQAWDAASARALGNAGRFRWDRLSGPIIERIEDFRG